MDEFLLQAMSDVCYCNGKAVMRQAVLKLLEEEKNVLKGSDRALIRYLIRKIERLVAI